MFFEVVIIGAGVTGCSIARELSKYSLSVALVEKACDVSFATSKANNGIIHAGYDPKPESWKGRLNSRGNYLYGQTTRELEIPFKRIGSLVVVTKENAEKEDGLKKLEDIKKRGEANGVPGLEVLDENSLREKEPNITPDAVAALFAPTAGIVCPYGYTIALAENAQANGVKLMLETSVSGVRVENEKVNGLETNKGVIDCSVAVNAAGVFSDEIARMAGVGDFQVLPRRGEYFLLEKNLNLVNHILFPLPSKMGKGITLTPTVDGNVLLGPTAEDVEDKEDVGTTRDGLDEAISGARKLIPKASKANVVSTFAGLRAVSNTNDFVLGETRVEGFVNAAGIQSPGLGAAPAIGELIAGIIVKKLDAKKKERFEPGRKAIPHVAKLPVEQANELIKSNPAFGRIVCRCEKVTEGEIVEAVKRGARTLDGVKLRVRSGMGKCQGGFCSSRVIEILSRELNVSPEQITKKGGKSNIVVGKTKE